MKRGTKMFNKIEDKLMIPFMKFKDESGERNFILEYIRYISILIHKCIN